jgi:RND family efflux transporter MFP subunit
MKGVFSVKRIVVGVIALGLAAVVVARVIQASNPPEPTQDVEEIREDAGMPVEVMEVVPTSLEARRSFTGPVRGIRSATVRARTGDEILEIPATVGRRVAQGDVVVRQSSQGSMASVRQAQAAFEQAQRNVDRLRPLHQKGAVSEQDWDNAQTALRVAEANLEAARKSVVLTSPIDGIVTDILVTPGTFPATGDPLVRISDLSQVQVLLQVSPDQRRELSMGQTAYLEGGSTPGRITRIALQADPQSRLVEVEVTFPGGAARTLAGQEAQGAAVLPGTLANVEVVVGTRDAALLVPPVALHDGSVWVVDHQDQAHRRPVETGLRATDQIEIVEGLSPGDRVVTAGASLLSEGTRVRIVGG